MGKDSPPGYQEGNCEILLAKAVGEEQEKSIGNQSGGRVFLFLYTDDFDRDYQNLLDQEVRIFREKSIESYGKVAVFEDLYGNLWDLIEPQTSHKKKITMKLARTISIIGHPLLLGSMYVVLMSFHNLPKHTAMAVSFLSFA
jgi:hypothetical protein